MIKRLLISVIIFTATSPFSFSQNKAADDIVKSVYNKDQPDTTRIASIVAYSHLWPNPSFGELVPLLDEAYELALKNNKPLLAQHLLNRKIHYYTSNGRGMEAFAICHEMLKLGEKNGDNEMIAHSFYHRGNIFRGYNMIARAVQEQIKAVDFYEKSENKLAWCDACYLLGWYAFNDKKYEMALVNLLRAYNNIQQLNKSDFGKMGEYSGWVGNSYNALQKFDSALYYRRLSMGYFSLSKDGYGYPDSYRYLGNIYSNMKKHDSAKVYYKKAHQLFTESGINERKWLMEFFMAEADYQLKNYKQSAATLDALLDSAKGSKDLFSLYLGNRLGGKVYEKNKEYVKAINCYKKFIVYKDSMEQGGKQGAVTELDAKLKFEMEENALKMEQAEKDAIALRDKERQALIRNFLLAGFVLMSVFVVVYYRNYKQKQKDNLLLEKQKNEIGAQKKEIQDSINYAQNIQSSVLPEIQELEKHFNEMFVFYKPKDVVSGDFFWFSKSDDKILVAAADCTGHGVPGAFMSMIGSYELNNSVLERGLTEPDKILTHINFSLKKRLKQNEKQTNNKDGMDIALCSFDLKNQKLNFAGANRPLYIVRENEAMEFTPNKTAIGGYTASDFEFSNNSISLQKGDCVYMYTDGYSDQFGGDKNKKLTTKRFKELLKSISSLSMKEQYRKLEEHFYLWKGNFDQLDDVLVIGVRV